MTARGRADEARPPPPWVEPEIGLRVPVPDLIAAGTVAVRLHDGSHHTLGQGVGADADGHPLDAVARLAQELAAFGQRLEAGDLVITGGLTKRLVSWRWGRG